MLGHQLARVLGERHAVTVCIRHREDAEGFPVSYVRVLGGVDLGSEDAVDTVIAAGKWSVVVNAAGLVKQRPESGDAARAIAVNALLPQRIAGACADRNIRFIHFSTDCVFSGDPQSNRGKSGYRLDDVPDARDLYGLSKLLGEPATPGSLCIRTSFIGRELKGHRGLLEWFLNAGTDEVPGYVNALFSGITTPVAARLVDELITRHPGLQGTWHAAGGSVSKYDLLRMIRSSFGLTREVRPEEGVFCDRRLDGSALRARTGWKAPPWPTMIRELAETPSLGRL